MMKKLLFLLCIAGSAFLTGCDERLVVDVVRYTVNEPVFMSVQEFRDQIYITEESRPIENRGKICFYNGYLYISESGKGIHIIDNQHPASPQAVGFIELMGNADLITKDNKLYADSYMDLVWFDITNPAKPELKGHVENVFYQSFPETGNDYRISSNAYNAYMEKPDSVIIGWELKEVEERTKSYESKWNGSLSMDASSNGGGSSTGLTGSMSRFGIYQDYLYTILNSYMGVFNISGEQPVMVKEKQYIDWEPETIFSYKDHLFFGTPTGMLIYSVANPTSPEYVSSIRHVYGCDPVVVENDLAYVTIRSGNFCGQNNNELFVIDVSDVENPRQIVSYTMTNPKGLGIDNGILFICDDGLKIYKADDPQTIMANLLVHYSGMDGFDVIPYNNTLMMIADDGLYQYDYSDLENITQLSKFSTK